MRLLKWLFGRSKTPHLPKNFREKLDSDSVDIIRSLQKAGHEAYLVGGCVRDLLLDHVPKDFDIATSATPQQVKALVKRSFIIGRRFRIVVAKRRVPPMALGSSLFPVLNTNLEKEIQITTFRRDPVEVNGVINENVFGTAEQDASRRDFTINALFLDPVKAEVLDFVGANEDLKRRSVRVIGDPLVRFQEDPIRIFRALRFKTRTGLKLHPETEKALSKAVPWLAEAKRERIREEIIKVLREGTLNAMMDEMDRYGLWPIVAPQMYAWLHDRDMAFREYINAVGASLKAEKWPDPKDAAPLFYLLLHPARLKDEPRARQMEKILDELKVSRAERDEMDRIHMLMDRIQKDREAKHAGRILTQNPRQAKSNVQTFFVIFTLAQAHIAPYDRLWNSWEGPWKDYVRWLTHEAQSSSGPRSAHSGGGQGSTGRGYGGRRSSRRGGRRRSRSTAAPSSSPPTPSVAGPSDDGGA